MVEAKLTGYRVALTTVAALLLIALGTHSSGAVFTAQSSNPDNTFSAALDFCMDGGTQTLSANKDSYVDEALAGLNFGTSANSLVQSLLNGNKRTLIGFELPAIPDRCQLTGATLRLYATGVNTSRTIDVLRANAPWTEGGVTWNTRPAGTGSAVSAAATNAWVSWNVKDHVSAMYAGANNGFVVRDSAEGATLAKLQTYASRETLLGHPPELELVFE